MPQPLDLTLCLDAALGPAQTDVTQVTVKVRKNGGAPTTYTNATPTAITQSPDAANGFHLEVAGGTYAAGDRVSHAWYYGGVQVNGCYGETIIGPASVDGGHYTAARGDKLDELDAAVSSRADGSVWTSALASVLGALSTRAGTAQAGSSNTITLDAAASGLTDFYVGQWVVIQSGAGAGQSRLITAYNGSTKVATVHTNWKTQPTSSSVFCLLAAADIQGVVLADTVTALTNAPADSAGVTTLLSRLTGGRAANLDFLDVAVSSRATVAAVWAAVVDSPGVGTLLGRLTSLRAGLLDNLSNLDHASSDLDTELDALTTAVAAAKTELDAVKAQTDLLPADPASESGVIAAIPSSGEIAGDVWDEAASAHTTAGTFGKLASFLDAPISGVAAAVWAAVVDSPGVTSLLARLTTQRAANLDHLDADVSSRSTYAGTDTPGTTTLLGRLTGTRATNLDNLDAPVSGIAAAVWAVTTRTLTAVADSAGVTSLLARLTPQRATNLDHLDADVSSRLAAGAYTAPDNAGIAAIEAKTGLLPSDPASESGVIAAIPTPIDNASEVWSWTGRTLDSWTGLAAVIWAAVVDSPGVTALLARLTNSRAANLDNLDAPVSSRLDAGVYVAPDNADIVAIRAKTDLIGTANASIATAITKDGAIRLTKGDSYLAADGNAIGFSDDDLVWPTGITAAYLLIGDELTITGDIAGLTASPPTISFDLLSTDTEQLAGADPYAFVVTLSSGGTMTLERGTCNSVRNPAGAPA